MKLRILEFRSRVFRIVYEYKPGLWLYVKRYDKDGFLETAEYNDLNECRDVISDIEKVDLRWSIKGNVILFEKDARSIFEKII